jgi:hypothetical protein
MRSGRLASIFILFPLAVACFDISSGLEHWPFSSYPMFSFLFVRHLSVLRLYAVNGAEEIPVKVGRDFAPFEETRLISALSRLRESEPGRRKLPLALLSLLRLHHRNTHTVIRSLRLYSVGWTLLPGMPGNAAPERKILLAEVSGH